jgi:hypothetical protein
MQLPGFKTTKVIAFLNDTGRTFRSTTDDAGAFSFECARGEVKPGAVVPLAKGKKPREGAQLYYAHRMNGVGLSSAIALHNNIVGNMMPVQEGAGSTPTTQGDSGGGLYQKNAQEKLELVGMLLGGTRDHNTYSGTEFVAAAMEATKNIRMPSSSTQVAQNGL